MVQECASEVVTLFVHYYDILYTFVGQLRGPFSLHCNGPIGGQYCHPLIVVILFMVQSFFRHSPSPFLPTPRQSCTNVKGPIFGFKTVTLVTNLEDSLNVLNSWKFHEMMANGMLHGDLKSWALPM